MRIEVLYLSLLGPPQLFADGKLVTQSPRKAAALAAYLAARGETVDRSVMAGMLWEADDEVARRNLRQELFRLKGTPWESVIAGQGQSLLLGEVRTDLGDFLKHLARGEWSVAVGLWRGGFLQGSDLRLPDNYYDWLMTEQERWRGLYQEALRGWARSLEASGNPREALKIYQQILAEDPLQELEQQAVMRLLAGLGELPTALKQYEQYSERLQHELGLEPMPETLALYRYLKVGKTPQAIPSTPSSLLEPPMVGRLEDWAWLETHWGGGLLLLVGEAGVGKSRLAQEFARRKGETLRVLQRESGQGLAFGGWIEALRGAFEGGWTPTHLRTAWRTELGRLIPELEEEYRQLVGAARSRTGKTRIRTPEATQVSSGENKIRLFEALVQAVLDCIKPGGTVLWEDLHFADAPSLEFLPYLVRRARSLGLFVVATVRPEGLLEGILERTWRTLEQEQAVHLHTLGPLPREGILELLRQLTGQQGGERFAERLYQATGGNPLYVSETLRYLFDQGLLRVDARGWHTPFDETTTDYQELPMPPNLSDAVLGRLQRLGSGSLFLAQALALVDSPISGELLSGLLSQESVRVDDLEALLASGLVREESEGYVLRHELVRAAVVEKLPIARRAWLHLRLAEALKLSGADPARYAVHFEAAGNRQETAQAHLAAARNLRRGPLVRQALQHYGKVLELMNPSTLPAERFRVLAETAELHLSVGDSVQGLERELVGLAEQLGSHELFRVRLLQAESAVRSGAVASGIRAAQDALTLAQTPWQRGHALFSLSWLHYRGGDADAQLELLEEAIRSFRELGDSYMEAFALRNLAGYYARMGEIATFESAWDQAYGLAAELEDELLLRRLGADKANVDWVRGRYAESRQVGNELLREARKQGDLWAVWDALHLLLLNAMALGLSAELEQEVKAALQEARAVEALRDEALLRSDLGQVLLTENRLAEAAQEFEQALKTLEHLGEKASLGHALFGYGYTLVELKRLEEGLGYLRKATEVWERRKEWRNSARTLAVTSLALNRLKQQKEAAQAAKLALERLEPWAEGLYDSALIHYALARALGTHEGRPHLIKAQEQLRSLSQRLPAEEAKRFLQNRFVRWALDKPT